LNHAVYAFPKQRKEPLTDAGHVRNAMAHFNQVKEVSDDDRDLAFANIVKAAACFGITFDETDWHEFGKKTQKNRLIFPHSKEVANAHSFYSKSD